MADKRVEVQNGKGGYYKIHENGNKYTVYRVNIGIIVDDKKNIGEVKSLEDALSLIRSHSGQEIKKIS